MNDDLMPIHYSVEIYEESFGNDPTAILKASTPFIPFNVGDFIDPKAGGFTGFPNGNWLKVKSVVHWLWKIDGSHIGQKIGVCVSVVASPVE